MKNIHKSIKTIIFFCGICIVCCSFAVQFNAEQPFSKANQTANSTDNSTSEVQPQHSNQQPQDFFKDSDYEHFAPEKGFEFINP